MITVVIPCREPIRAETTLASLRRQTHRPARIVIQPDHGKGAAWARNTGFKQVETEFVLFSDDDIKWRPDALEALRTTLRANPEAAFAYGAYRCNWRGPELHTISWQTYDAELLKVKNYISTMSLIKSADFPGFDETLRRYMDWDLWLTMAAQGKTGVFCGKLIFDTRLRPDGITWGTVTMAQARAIIEQKHNLKGNHDGIQ